MLNGINSVNKSHSFGAKVITPKSFLKKLEQHELKAVDQFVKKASVDGELVKVELSGSKSIKMKVTGPNRTKNTEHLKKADIESTDANSMSEALGEMYEKSVQIIKQLFHNGK